VAFDGGESVTKAVNYMSTSSLFEDIDCHLLHVGEPSAKVRRSLDSAAASLQAAGRRSSTEIRPGQAEKVIADAVDGDGAHLLVMGAYGHSRIRTLIIGSTTTTMMRLCKVPVMLFR
jgi:nucleotide-binding universal stress UspA family protein